MELSLTELKTIEEALLGVKDFKVGKESMVDSLMKKISDNVSERLRKELKYKVVSMRFDLEGMHIITNTKVDTLQDAENVVYYQESSKDLRLCKEFVNEGCLAPTRVLLANHYTNNGDFHHSVIWLLYPISTEKDEDDF